MWWNAIFLAGVSAVSAQYYGYGGQRTHGVSRGYSQLAQYAPVRQAYGPSAYPTYGTGQVYSAPQSYGTQQHPALQARAFQPEYGLPLGADRALVFPRDFAAQNLKSAGGYAYGGQTTVLDPAGNSYRSFGIFGDGHLRTRGEGGLKK